MAETPDQLERYKKDARDILIAFAEQTVEASRSAIEKEAITLRVENAAKQIAESASFRRQLWFGIVATGVNTLVLLLLAIGIRLLGIDLLEILHQI